ncbi:MULTISPECIES: hypothetical protein [unclassified Moorena]|uniref:hypothetical protein n=1 Tax=unclassified Moorena TaxID=2683338 RepID=UPI0013F7F75E|nr:MULTISPECIES: hypothetical protein [unclassified Moorena]NEP25806.1 hypothetical protein [Moorena sp. SIO3I6]NEQ59214.1 hypothetical protein [Moorena sp. SIO4A1]
MVGLKKPKKLRRYDLRMGKQKLGMVIPFGINLESRVAQGRFCHSDDPRSHHCRAPITIKTPSSQLGAIIQEIYLY